MQQDWFEMKDLERRRYNNAVWIPLLGSFSEKSGDFGYAGYKDDHFQCGSLAVPISMKDAASKLGWMDIGFIDSHGPSIDDEGNYSPTGLYTNHDDIEGVFLALDQYMEPPHVREWHLNQDFVIALGLMRESDTWVRPSEGYIEVARLKRKPNGFPCLLEVRAEHLKDYLCARKMMLFLPTYRERQVVVRDYPSFTWENNASSKETDTDNWEGYIEEIHEGGMSFGATAAVYNFTRTDVDKLEDVPTMSPPTDENVKSSYFTKGYSGDKCHRVVGRQWRNEWIAPSEYSPRILHDELPPTVFFITNSEGKRESKDTLLVERKWLWFKPSIITDLIERRGGHMEMYTAQTGQVGCIQSCCVHFGVNSLGLINVYAEDIATLPDWQQQVWAGHNVAPEGGVSDELLAAQVDANPASTQAPESYIEPGIELINEIASTKLGFHIFKEHDEKMRILRSCHRFRVTDTPNLYALAKDLTRVTAEAIDTTKIQQIVRPGKGEKWGSLKSLEKLLASQIDPADARNIMGRLVGIYELRGADAHLPSSKTEETLKLVNIDCNSPYIYQGYQMIRSCVGGLYCIVNVLEQWKKPVTSTYY